LPDPTRVLPELVYTMFVPLAKPIERANDARLLKIAVSVKGKKVRRPHVHVPSHHPTILTILTILRTISPPLPSDQGPAKLELPTGGYQRVTKSEDAQKLFVSIDLLDPVPATEEELNNKEYMAPSAMVDNNDEVTTRTRTPTLTRTLLP
jgi:hypothetical protein